MKCIHRQNSKRGERRFWQTVCKRRKSRKTFLFAFLTWHSLDFPSTWNTSEGSGATSVMATVQPWDKSSSFWLEEWSVLLSSCPASHFSLYSWSWTALRGTGLEFRLPKESRRDSPLSPASLCTELPESPQNPSYPVSPKSSSQLLWLHCEQHQDKVEAQQRAGLAFAGRASTKRIRGGGKRKTS